MPDSVHVEFDVPARMRDGVGLRANVYRPDGPGPWPTLLTRTPYGKDDPMNSATLDPVAVARRGFMVVVQDTRGRFASDGAWLPLAHERSDGYDSVEWAARLPGSNGRVGMYGGSYCGNTQWMAALERPPSLAAIVPLLTWSEPLDGLLARGGALELGLELRWALETGATQLAKLPLSDGDRAARLGVILDEADQLAADGYWQLPTHDAALHRRRGLQGLGTTQLLADPSIAARSRVEHARATAPSMNIGGWYDIFVQGTLDNYAAMAARGRPASLVVGPWAHNDPGLSDPTGELCFGIRSSGIGGWVRAGKDVNELQLDWLRRHAGADPSGTDAPDPPVRVFVMGRNQWRDEPAWPLQRARVQHWLLGAGGRLHPGPPGSGEPPSEFTYDPSDPVPTVGGQTVMSPEFPPGPRDQTAVEARDDVLVFTSEPLLEELEVTGRVRLVLHAESSAPSTDFVGRLCDVHLDGRSFNVCDGILRVASGAREGNRYELDLWSTSIVFLPGHRIRLHVTSSSFPRWDRNLNTGRQQEPRWETARQRIHHDADRPSYIELPVVGGTAA